MNNLSNKYYDYIMGISDKSFRSEFEKKWKSELLTLPETYRYAKQLQIGNRLRPCLVCWGYALSSNSIQELDYDKIMDISLGIEFLHKGSIIIDDMIDNDSARRGQMSFHVQYSKNESMLFTLFLMGKVVEKLSKYVNANDLSNLLCLMSSCALKEVTSSIDNQLNIKDAIDIIKGETEILIRDSLVFGYRQGISFSRTVEFTLKEISNKCAYIFQLLNDLEPFSMTNKNTMYKNNVNYDIEKHRKNLVIALLYQQCSNKDKNILYNCIDKDYVYDTIKNLINQYKFKDYILNLSHNIQEEIFDKIDSIKTVNIDCINDFKMFILQLLTICYERL